MRNHEQEVLAAAAGWLQHSGSAWLCTIVGTAGSSPRPLGAMLALRSEREIVGSLSGGCVEEDLVDRLLSGEVAGLGPQVVDYGVTAEENERLGLPCGGRLRILAQRLTYERDHPWLSQCVSALDGRSCIERSLRIVDGVTQVRSVPRATLLEFDEGRLRQSFGPRQRLLLVGAGQLAQTLSELAIALGFEVLVTDPRGPLLAEWRGPEVRLIGGMPDDVIRDGAVDRFTAVITLTHDPRIDDMALMEALDSPAWYVGALGSSRTTEKRLVRLRQLGIGPDALGRLHAPVGLPIGSKTPAEIAVSIAAELVKERRLTL